MPLCDSFAYAPATVTAGIFDLLILKRPVPATITSLSLTLGIDVTGGTHGDVQAYYQFFDANLASVQTAHLGTVVSGGGPSTWVIAVTAGARYLDVSVESGGVAITDLVWVRGEVTCGAGSSDYCAYGTRAQGSTVSGIIITTGLIDLLLTAMALPAWLAVVFDTFIGKVVWGGDLCNGLPPAMPVFTNADFIGELPNVANPVSRDKFWQGMLAVMWPYFCECVPGPALSTPFVAPPPPAPLRPDAAPLAPHVVDCDGADICTLFNSLARQLVAISSQVANLRNDVTLIQRQAAPFAYVPGLLHSGLTGAGQFAVQGLLGLAVEVTTVPGASGEEAGDPVARFGLGWVTTGTPDGWRRSTPIRANPQWVDAQPDDTLVGYSLEPLVVANIQELMREP